MLCFLSFNVASSKQRSNLRRAITADKTKLRRAIQKYCSVQEYLQPSERIHLDEDAIVAGEFPWSALTGMCIMQTKFDLIFYNQSQCTLYTLILHVF